MRKGSESRFKKTAKAAAKQGKKVRKRWSKGLRDQNWVEEKELRGMRKNTVKESKFMAKQQPSPRPVNNALQNLDRTMCVR